MSFPARTGSTVAEVDLAALAHNLQEVRRAAGSARPGILAAVKADAYGHGAVQVSRVLEREGVTMLGVARIEEGVELREAGLELPILVLSGVPYGGPPPFQSLDERLGELLRHRIVPTLFDVRGILAIDRLLQRRELEKLAGDLTPPVRIDYHLKVDTGMGRIGLPVEALREAIPVLASLKHMRLVGAMTHLADADGAGEEAAAYTRSQIDRFHTALGPLQTLADGPLLVHIANSAAAARGVACDLDLIRPGIALYGCAPFPGHGMDLKPVMRVATRVLFVKEVPAGTPISYGRTFVTRRPSRIATLPVGYGDGYPRALSNKGEVLIGGKRCPVAGRVCMDLTMVDVTDLPAAAPGDEAVLVGAQKGPAGDGRMSAEELASKAGTISYELLCQISKRVPRVYRGSGDPSAKT